MDTTLLTDTLNKVISDSEASILSIAAEGEQEVIQASTEFLNGLKTRGADYLRVIADDSQEGKTVDKLAFLKDSLLNEKAIFESETVTYSIIGKQVAQNIINSLIGILTTAILSVLPAQA